MTTEEYLKPPNYTRK